MFAADLRNLEKAAELALTSEHPQWKLGCLIVRQSHVSTGVNKSRGEASSEYFVPTFHAEVVALRNAKDGGKGSVAYVARVGRNGKLGMARPCKNCMAELVTAGIKRVVYTTDDGIKEESLRKS